MINPRVSTGQSIATAIDIILREFKAKADPD